MGIPAYFRWISEKYPRIMVNCVEQLLMNGTSEPTPPIDISAPNPNGIEFDNLYLDMNGIIHPCTHPEDRPAPTTEAEMFEAVNDYIDRIMAIIRPRKVVYMAIDGVAPRAKINQQRSRRFRAAKEAEEKAREAEALRCEWEKLGLRVSGLAKSIPSALKQAASDAGDSENYSETPFDSNVITPGTPFMERLAISLRDYVARRVACTPGWSDLRIILSDSSVPGEGEHKIAEYIRIERAMPGYNPNLRHCLYGLDADLIMLALATHEVHFSVLREEVFPKNGRQQPGANGNAQISIGHQEPVQIDTIMAAAELETDKTLSTRAELGGKKPFQFLHVSVLREYLDLEFRYDIECEIAAARSNPRTGAPLANSFEFENVIDDFVFLCFFVGNDFLPHLPTLDIREGAVDYLIEVYKTDLPHVGYLTSGAGDVDFSRVKEMLARIGQKEDDVFRERAAKEAQSLARAAEDRRRAQDEKQKKEHAGLQFPSPSGDSFQQPQVSTDATAQIAPEPKSQIVLDGSESRNDVSQANINKIPPDEELTELGNKNKNPRVGDGSVNKAAAAQLKRVMEARNLKLIKLKSPKASNSNQNKVFSGGITKPGHKDDKSSALASTVINVVKSESSTNPLNGQSNDAHSANAAVLEKTGSEFAEELRVRMRNRNEIENPTDNIRLGEEGWKDRYYKHKFNWAPTDFDHREKLCQDYLDGLYWVMKYYYVGCISWNWYYPYHYAPFASDIVLSSCCKANIQMERGAPFRPFTQLQAVMPASSGILVLPKCYSDLMIDSKSPIIDYYPRDFEIDLNGKRFAWQGVALLPFIDEDRLNLALSSLEPQLTDEERKRNSFGDCIVVARRTSPLGAFLESLKQSDATQLYDIPEPVAEGQLFGTLSPLGALNENGLVLTAKFELPPPRAHITTVLDGAKVAPMALDDVAKAETRQRGGWKAARFGSLGRAARELADMRRSRTSGNTRRGSRHEPHKATSFQSQQYSMPTHPVAAAMFGGLGNTAQQQQQPPGWMTQSRPVAGAAWRERQQHEIAQPTTWRGKQSQASGNPAGRGRVQQHFYQQHPYNAEQPPSQAYGYGSNAYYSQYYQNPQYGSQQTWNGSNMSQGSAPSGYGGQAAQSYTTPYDYGYEQYGAWGYPSAGPYAQEGDPNHYAYGSSNNFYGQTSNRAGTGGGLAGPTATQLRQGSMPHSGPRNYHATNTRGRGGRGAHRRR